MAIKLLPIWYKNKWNKKKRQPRRVQGQNITVGKIAGGGAEGLIIWKDDFIAEYPLLDELDTIEQILFKDGSDYSEVTGLPRKILEALDIPLPTTERFDSLLEDEDDLDNEDIRNLEDIDEDLSKLGPKS